ncbi:MAG: hypothetical protein DMG38_27060 [Acidobacteria bacterium]|nr:MAG: hypothetical protein DMG38_27060 [Acidobacteriota bacterium]
MNGRIVAANTQVRTESCRADTLSVHVLKILIDSFLSLNPLRNMARAANLQARTLHSEVSE